MIWQPGNPDSSPSGPSGGGAGKDSSYPGVEFTPPAGVIGESESEGEAIVTWRKIGDRFTITSMEGRPMPPQRPERPEPAPSTSMSADAELDSIASE